MEGPMEAKTYDACDMDREEFCPKLYMIKFAKDCNLPQMISRRNTIDDEIVSLNTEMQNLLYDNYTKFISAASTVSDMKTDFEKMEGEMKELQTQMQDFESTSSALLEKLRPRKEKICELLKCRGIMKKLVLLTDLVPNLQMHYRSGNFAAAARLYLRAENLLKKYQNLSSFKGIVKDTMEIMMQVKQALKERLNCEIFGKEELTETLYLILKLGEDPRSALEYFLLRAEDNLSSSLAKIGDRWSILEGDSDLQKTLRAEARMTEYIECSCEYIDRMSKIIEVVRDVFLNNEFRRASFPVLAILDDFVTTKVKSLSAKIRAKFREKFTYIDDNFLAHILDKFHRRCHSCGIIFPQISFLRKNVEIILETCAERSEFHLLGMKETLRSLLTRLLEELKESGHHLGNTLSWFKCQMEAILSKTYSSVQHYIRPEFRCCRNVRFRKIFCKVLVREGVFVAFIRYTNETIWKLLNSLEQKNESKLGTWVLFSRYLRDSHHFIVPRYMSMVDHHLCAPEEDLRITPIMDILKECEGLARKILDMYVRIRQERMSLMIRKSFENKNWIDSNEPRRARAVIKRLLEDLEASQRESESVFGSMESPTRVRSRDSGRLICLKARSREASPSENTAEERLLINRIFQRPKSLQKVDFKSRSIMSCIVLLTLKSFLECVRLKTFGRFGMQQIQVDVHYFRLRVFQIVNEEDDFIALFDDILSSCWNRTLDPEFMNLSIVNAICQDSN